MTLQLSLVEDVSMPLESSVHNLGAFGNVLSLHKKVDEKYLEDVVQQIEETESGKVVEIHFEDVYEAKEAKRILQLMNYEVLGILPVKDVTPIEIFGRRNTPYIMHVLGGQD